MKSVLVVLFGSILAIPFIHIDGMEYHDFKRTDSIMNYGTHKVNQYKIQYEKEKDYLLNNIHRMGDNHCIVILENRQPISSGVKIEKVCVSLCPSNSNHSKFFK